MGAEVILKLYVFGLVFDVSIDIFYFRRICRHKKRISEISNVKCQFSSMSLKSYPAEDETAEN